MAEHSTSSSGQVMTTPLGKAKKISKTRKTLSKHSWRDTPTDHERQQLLESAKMAHYALTITIAGIQTRKSRKEILPVLHGLSDVLLVMQRRLDKTIKNPSILIGVPSAETNRVFDGYQPCLGHYQNPAYCHGETCEECDKAFLENPEAWLDEVHLARQYLRNTYHRPRTIAQQPQIIEHTTRDIPVWNPDFNEPEFTTQTFTLDLSNWTPQIPQIPQNLQTPEVPEIPETQEYPQNPQTTQESQSPQYPSPAPEPDIPLLSPSSPRSMSTTDPGSPTQTNRHLLQRYLDAPWDPRYAIEPEADPRRSPSTVPTDPQNPQNSQRSQASTMPPISPYLPPSEPPPTDYGSEHSIPSNLQYHRLPDNTLSMTWRDPDNNQHHDQDIFW